MLATSEEKRIQKGRFAGEKSHWQQRQVEKLGANLNKVIEVFKSWAV